MKLDETKIIEAIMAEKQAPIASETAAALVEGWLARFIAEDSTRKVAAVETGFSIWLDAHTLIVGVLDAIFSDGDGYLGGEWKSKRAPRMTLAGRPYAGDTEEDWLQGITEGPQLAIYALALHAGTFFEKGNPQPIEFQVQNPRIMVRCALKSDPPAYYPTETSGIYTFTTEYLDSIESGLASKANQIRGARRNPDLVPWSLVGKPCREWGRPCPYLDPYCSKHAHPIGEAIAIFDANNPAYELALKRIDPERLKDPDLVVLSASSYQTAVSCMEKFRLLNFHGGEKDTSIDLAIGSCMHAGIAEYLRQIKNA